MRVCVSARAGSRVAELSGRVHALSECVWRCVCVVYAHSQVGHYILLDLSIDERMDVPRS